MRPLRLLCAAAFVLALPVLPAASRAEEPGSAVAADDLEQTLVALERRSWEAWKNRDGAFFERFVSDDHLDVHSNGPIDGKAVVAGVASPACVVASYSVGEFRFRRLAPDAALLVYRAEQATTCGGRAVPSPSWITSVYVRRDGRWQNALFQVTDAAPKK